MLNILRVLYHEIQLHVELAPHELRTKENIIHNTSKHIFPYLRLTDDMCEFLGIGADIRLRTIFIIFLHIFHPLF